MNKYLIGLCAACLLITMAVNADSQTDIQPQSTVQIQVVKDQLNLTKQSFKSIQVVNEGNDRYTVQVELTSDAAKQMHELTANNINHLITIVWHRYVLSAAKIISPLGAKFQITGFNQELAQAFVQGMQSK